MHFNTFNIACLLAAISLPTALAVPKVKSVPISGGCAAYPGYDASSGTAGPWVVQIVQTGGSPIEGFYDTSHEIKFSNGSTEVGYITFPSNDELAKNAIRCSPSSTPSLETLTSNGWTKLSISPYPKEAGLIYPGPGVTLPKNSTPVLPYSLYNTKGVKLDGVYLGGYNDTSKTTTWAVKYVQAQDYYFVRLFGPNAGGLAKGEFTAFIKVNA